MRVEVYRGAGDRPGVEISEPLLNGEASLIERGRAEMDERAHPRRTISLTIVPRPGLRQGLLVRRVQEGRAPWVARIVGLSWEPGTDQDPQTVVKVDLERPL